MEGREWLRKLKQTVRRSKPDMPDPAWPDWYAAYASQYLAEPMDPLRELAEANVVVLDAETTGLDLKKDRLISLGALQVRGNTIKVEGHFEAYLPTPADYQGRDAISIHGILPNSHRYTYDREDELLARLLTFLGPERIIVGHHIGFDLEMINQALARQGAGPLRNKLVDTARLAERLQPAGYWTPPDQFSLDNLARRYRIPLSDRHTALGDAYITAVLWLKLTARLAEKKGRALVVGDV